MKCAYCSTRLEPREWFCSNCKRSRRASARPTRQPEPWTTRALTAFLALSAGAAVGAQPWFRVRVGAPARPLSAFAPVPSPDAAGPAGPAISPGRLVPASFAVTPLARP